MDSNFNKNVENIRVGIFRNGDSYTAKILPFDYDNAATEQAVAIRSFSEMALALGYCFVINQVSKASVEQIMKQAVRSIIAVYFF